MSIRTIDPLLSVGGQIRPEEVAALAAEGFRSVICTGPDGEGEDRGQPAFAALGAMAGHPAR